MLNTECKLGELAEGSEGTDHTGLQKLVGEWETRKGCQQGQPEGQCAMSERPLGSHVDWKRETEDQGEGEKRVRGEESKTRQTGKSAQEDGD